MHRKDGKVKIRSRLAANIIPNRQKRDEKINYTQGVLEVDISDLKGDKFTPGCASSEPKINFYISEFSKDYKYDIPKELTTSQDLKYDDIRKQMMEDKKQACIDEIIKNGSSSNKALDSLSELTGLDKKNLADFKKNNILEGLKKVTVSEIQNLPQDAKIEALAVKCYKEVNIDTEKLKEFAKQQLLKYCDKQDIKVLDSKETEKIKTGIVAILDPVIDDPRDKKDLDNNIKGAIRACAKQENVSMSFKERLKNFIEAIFKSNDITRTISQFQEVTQTAKKPNKFQDMLKKQEADSRMIKSR